LLYKKERKSTNYRCFFLKILNIGTGIGIVILGMIFLKYRTNLFHFRKNWKKTYFNLPQLRKQNLAFFLLLKYRYQT